MELSRIKYKVCAENVHVTLNIVVFPGGTYMLFIVVFLWGIT